MGCRRANALRTRMISRLPGSPLGYIATMFASSGNTAFRVRRYNMPARVRSFAVECWTSKIKGFFGSSPWALSTLSRGGLLRWRIKSTRGDPTTWILHGCSPPRLRRVALSLVAGRGGGGGPPIAWGAGSSTAPGRPPPRGGGDGGGQNLPARGPPPHSPPPPRPRTNPHPPL